MKCFIPFIFPINQIKPNQVKKSKFREPGGSKKKKNDAVAAGTGEVVKAELVERPREYVVTLHFPEVCSVHTWYNTKHIPSLVHAAVVFAVVVGGGGLMQFFVDGGVASVAVVGGDGVVTGIGIVARGCGGGVGGCDGGDGGEGGKVSTPRLKRRLKKKEGPRWFSC